MLCEFDRDGVHIECDFKELLVKNVAIESC